MNSTFRARWLASSEVISQVLFTSEQPKKNRMAFVAIFSQIKLLFGPLVNQLVWHIVKQLFTSVSLRGSVNIHHYSPPLRWIISNYWMRLSRIWRILQIKEGVFPLTKYNTLSPGFLGQRFNNLQQAALLTSFWRHWFNNFRRAALLTSLIQYGEDSFQIWWTAAGYGELCVWL